MAVTFILGRAGAGKTRYCVDAILSELGRDEHGGRLILLVPEQASFQMERTLATRSPRGGYSRAEVLSFSRLASRVFDHVGSEAEVLSPRARRLALRRVVARSGMALEALSRAARTAGFHTELERLIEELLREGVSPAALLDAAREMEADAGRKVRELAGLYAQYLDWLGPKRVDPAARLAVLRERLEELDWLPGARIWVDGFAGFTGQEVATLVTLARRACEVSITLLVDPVAQAVRDARQAPDEFGLFRRTELTYQCLRRLLDEAGVESCDPVELCPRGLPRFSRVPELAGLEGRLARPEMLVTGPTSSGAVRLQEYATHRDELRAVARWVRTRVADARGGLRYRDFAVIARDLGPLAQLVAEVFDEYEIPYFLDSRRSLRSHPLSRLIPALFEAVLSDLDKRPMVRLLRTRLLPMAVERAERLENVVTQEAARGLGLWRRPTWGLGGEEFGAERAAVVAALEPLIELARADEAATGAVWARALLTVVAEHLDVPRRLESWIAEARRTRCWESAELHRQAWDAFVGVLDDLHDVLGDTPLVAHEVAEVVGGALSELTMGLAPPAVDQVLVSSIERSRHPDIKHAWVLAFNEGIFPARPAEDVLLSTVEREGLTRAGLAAPASHRADALDERMLAYIAFTRPSESLTISYATRGADGSELPASPYLSALAGIRVERAPQHEPPAGVAELARGYLGVRRDAQRVVARRRYELLCDEVRGIEFQAGRLSWLLRGVEYRNRPPAIGHYRRPVGGAPGVIWNSSPSEVETYLQCPFQHFAKYGLRLDTASGPRPLRLELGSVAHELLAAVTRAALRESESVGTIPDERWQELLDGAASAYWEGQPADLARRRPDFVLMGEVLVTLLRDVVAAHAERWRRGCFEPLYCEQEYDPGGADGALRGLELALPDGRRVWLRGRIDRVDVCKQGGGTLLLVYDYKSKVGTVGGSYLTGGRLQLFIYVLALEQALGGDGSVRSAGVLLAPLYPKLDAISPQYVAEAGATEQLMYMLQPRGLVAEDVADLLDAHFGGGYSPVAKMRRKKDGNFYANDDTVPRELLDQYAELAQRTVAGAAEGVARGCIDVAPLVEGRKLACGWCEYRSVCRFDRAYNQPRAAEVALPQLDDIESGEGGEA